MAEEITSHELDNVLAEVTTQDRSVQLITLEVWGLYDDLVDHVIVTSKEGWDYLNRILVLLDSNAEVEAVRAWGSFGATESFAMVALASYTCLITRDGFAADSVIGWAIPFGLVSMMIAFANRHRRRNLERTPDMITAPFPSISTLMSARRKLRGFERMRYPPSLAKRRIRSRLNNVLIMIPSHLAWLFLSPLVLVVQAVPDREARFVMSANLRETADLKSFLGNH